MRVIIWIANHALWITLIGAACAVAGRFEKILPRRLHKVLLFISLFVTFAAPLLGLLKKSLDDQWKTEIERRTSARHITPELSMQLDRLIASKEPVRVTTNGEQEAGVFAQEIFAYFREHGAPRPAEGFVMGGASLARKGVSIEKTNDIYEILIGSKE